MNFSYKETKKEQSFGKQDHQKSAENKSPYVYELPPWDLMPPATFVIRRIHRL